jgi:hypothetical protein
MCMFANIHQSCSYDEEKYENYGFRFFKKHFYLKTLPYLLNMQHI